MDIYILLYLLIIVAPIGTILHEMGHAFGAIIVRADQVSLTIGIGNKIGTFSFHKFKVMFHAFFFIGGFVKSKRTKPYKRSEVIWITIFGPVSNGVFALLFYSLYLTYPNPYWKLLFLFNVWLAIVNIIPFKIGTKQSDGYSIIQAIREKKTQ